MVFLDARGVVAEFESLKIAEARDLWVFLKSGRNPHAKAVALRAAKEGEETVVFDLDVEVSQVRVHDIRPLERIAVSFTPQLWQPEVFALRADFPFVPHVNPREEEFPRSLCLYDQSFDEVSLRWTPAGFIEQVRWWLAEMAKGTLHGEDQPLEPILLDRFPPLILPADLPADLQEGAITTLDVVARSDLKVFRASREPVQGQGVSFLATVVECPPHVHGVIRNRPKNVTAVDELLRTTGLDLLGTLRDRINGWERTKIKLSAHLIVIALLPKQRKTDGPVESSEWWAFLLGKPVGELGRALGLWEIQGGAPGYILGGNPDNAMLSKIDVDVLNPMFELTRKGAAILNGAEPSEMKITAIGAGALGSQVIDNLARAGFGLWTGIDPDFLLPHNVARHEMTGAEVGADKVVGMQVRVNSFYREQAMPTAVVADILHLGEKEAAIRDAFESADLILDCSASQAVGRHLAHEAGKTRRCSVFLNPSGSDLVVLGEDQKRTKRLDWLEFQYYRKLIAEAKLNGHFIADTGRVRYARSCRDLTSRVPQHLVSLHSAIAAGVLQRVLRSDDAFIGVWACDRKLSVECFEVEPLSPETFVANGWTVMTDHYVLEKIAGLRRKESRKETGGVLIGAFDHRRKVIYMVDTVPSPLDSEEWPTLYIRGCQGLKAETDRIMKVTDGQVHYLGEWHSHPEGYSTDPSEDDRKVFGWLSEHMMRDGHPAVMLIAGGGDLRLFVNSMEEPISIRPGLGCQEVSNCERESQYENC